MSTLTLEPRVSATSESVMNRSRVIHAIITETGADAADAADFLDMLSDARDCAINGYSLAEVEEQPARADVYHLTGRDLHQFHDIYAVVMPDGEMPNPGSAHALINDLLLGEGSSLTLLHGQVGTEIRDCTVEVRLTPRT